MTSLSKVAHLLSPDLAKRDLAEYGVARLRDLVFDAVLALWRRRRSEGWTQKDIAELIGRDPGWVSKNLRAPGNWTLRTAGELVQALGGEAEITIAALEDADDELSNYDAYDGYIPTHSSARINFASMISPSPNLGMTIGMKNDSLSIKGSPT